MNTEQAIEILENHLYSGKMPSKEHFELLALAVETLKQQRWIPCGERIPLENQMVVVFSSSDRYYYVGKIDSVCENGQIIFAERGGYPYHYARYWMPLPEPPEEGECRNAVT